MGVRARAGLALLCALLIGAGAGWVFWPGIATYDTVAQYGQVLSGDYTDWHPPVTARLWTLLHARFAGGAAPMLAVQLSLYALGFGLFAQALARNGRGKAAVATLVLAGSPLLLGWQMVVLKDAQMVGALLAGVGAIAAYRLQERRIPPLVVAAVVLLFAYATLARGNAVFATAPLAVLLLPGVVRVPPRLLLIVVAMLATLAISPFINHRLFGAEPTTVINSQPLFDLAGIAVRTDPAPTDLYTAEERQTIIARHCSKAFFWDPLGDEIACAKTLERAEDLPSPALYRALANAVWAHPLAYAEHRLRHWNSTERWLVAPGLISAGPPAGAEANTIGLEAPTSPYAAKWQALAAAEAGTPLGWPILWTLAALIGTIMAFARRDTAAGRLAFALAGSALCLEASFLVVSIASDLRYHLWPMAAAALALILLADGTLVRRPAAASIAALLIVIVGAGLTTRTTLPPAPATYRAMIDAPTG